MPHVLHPDFATRERGVGPSTEREWSGGHEVGGHVVDVASVGTDFAIHIHVHRAIRPRARIEREQHVVPLARREYGGGSSARRKIRPAASQAHADFPLVEKYFPAGTTLARIERRYERPARRTDDPHEEGDAVGFFAAQRNAGAERHAAAIDARRRAVGTGDGRARIIFRRAAGGRPAVF